MAVLPGIPFKVTVQVSGNTAQEYLDREATQDLEPDVPTSTCYIKSRDGAEFSVKIRQTDSYKPRGVDGNSTVICTCVDGAHIQSTVISDTRSVVNGWLVDTHDGQIGMSRTTNLPVQRRLLFAPVTIGLCALDFVLENNSLKVAVDDDCPRRVANEIKHANNLGTITVKAYRATSHGPATLTNRVPDAKKLDFCQKSLKGRALSHGAGFTAEEPTTAMEFEHCTNYLLVAVLNFKYRSREALQHEMILPRSLTPEPADVLSGLSREEIDKLARERLLKIESAKKESGATLRATSQTLFTGPSNCVQVIDLTDD